MIMKLNINIFIYIYGFILFLIYSVIKKLIFLRKINIVNLLIDMFDYIFVVN